LYFVARPAPLKSPRAYRRVLDAAITARAPNSALPAPFAYNLSSSARSCGMKFSAIRTFFTYIH
jgi:hypothetical protein